jgi:hypothetical protein
MMILVFDPVEACAEFVTSGKVQWQKQSEFLRTADTVWLQNYRYASLNDDDEESTCCWTSVPFRGGDS